MRVFALMTASVLALSSCTEEEERPSPKFQGGQMVKMKAFGHQGMVLFSSCYRKQGKCYYTVRFDAMQIKTDVSLLGSDGPIQFSPVSVVGSIHEFELEEVK